jgi:hypothetical protein
VQVARTRAPEAFPLRIPVGASSMTRESKIDASHPLAPRRYGSGKGLPRVTESAVTKTFGVVRLAVGRAFEA